MHFMKQPARQQSDQLPLSLTLPTYPTEITKDIRHAR
jgi:hypothetical protein